MDNTIYPNLYIGGYLSKTVNLSSSARILLDLFISFMDPEENLIYFCDGGMDFYLNYCQNTLKVDYAEKTVRNALTELCKNKLIVKYQKDVYYVNPLYFCKMHFNFNHKKLITKVETYTGEILINDRMREVSFKGSNEQESKPDENKQIDEQP